MKEWECVQVGHHKKIGKVIEMHQKIGWRLHTYQAMGTPAIANHYLLFVRENGEKTPPPVEATATAAT